jgi:hypothetical protein
MLNGLGALKTVLPQLRHLQSIELLLIDAPPNLIPNTDLIQGVVLDFGYHCPSLKHMAMCEWLFFFLLNTSAKRVLILDGLVWARQEKNVWRQVTHGGRIQIAIASPMLTSMSSGSQ